MGMFDTIKKQAENFIAENPDKLEKISDTVIEKAGDQADQRTGGKYTAQIDSAQEKADDAVGTKD